jgi:hypothetical protein
VTADRDGDHGRSGGITRAVADRIAGVRALPTAIRAVAGYYARTGVLAVSAIRVQRAAERTVDRAVADAFGDVEAAIADEFDRDPATVEFGYETKLTMPAELTVGHVYHRARREAPDGVDPLSEAAGAAGTDRQSGDGAGAAAGTGSGAEPAAGSGPAAEVARARAVTDLVVAALLDGDMRDALNDAEFEDFEVGFPADEADRERIAAVAQAALAERVEARFARFDDGVRAAYERAVERSEAHQERDPEFRELMRRAEAGDDAALDRIRAEYRDAAFEGDGEESLAAFGDTAADLPYLETQYGRVGVIYDGMIDMYRAAGVPIEDAFERAIVLAIVGAQIWLDDVDDYRRDLAATQLTPVTAEYLLCDSRAAARRAVVDAAERYFDAARRFASEADSQLAGIGIDYIRRSGSPDRLPGGEEPSDT